MVHEVCAKGVSGYAHELHRERRAGPRPHQRLDHDHSGCDQDQSRHSANFTVSTCPPVARDRLIGLADSAKNLIGTLEQGKLPPHLAADVLRAHLKKIAGILFQMLDRLGI